MNTQSYFEQIKLVDLHKIKLIAEDNLGYKFYLTLDRLISLIELKIKNQENF